MCHQHSQCSLYVVCHQRLLSLSLCVNPKAQGSNTTLLWSTLTHDLAQSWRHGGGIPFSSLSDSVHCDVGRDRWNSHDWSGDFGGQTRPTKGRDWTLLLVAVLIYYILEYRSTAHIKPVYSAKPFFTHGRHTQCIQYAQISL